MKKSVKGCKNNATKKSFGPGKQKRKFGHLVPRELRVNKRFYYNREE